MKKDTVKLITRRDFLKITGMTVGGAASSYWLLSDLMAVPQRLLEKMANSRGEESWQNTVCRQCTAGCGIAVRKIDNIPVYVKGNPIYPVNRGGVCPMAHTSMEVLFNPDRVKSPMLRRGTKGREGWEEIGWKEAIASLSQRLKELIDRGEGHRIAMINGDDSPLMRAVCQYWMKAMGSPNYFEDERFTDNSIVVNLSQAMDTTPVYDIINSRYILNFGSNFLEEGNSPVYYNQIFGHLRETTREGSTTLVHIDSRINLTGSNSDRWVAIRPGTHGALALGIACVLIADRLYDRSFIEAHTTGFKPFSDSSGREHAGFESFVRGNYYPEKVSQLTGVPAETIVRLAEEFGTRKPAVAMSDDAARYATNGSFSQWAVYCLNALVGNFQKKGGVYFSHPAPEIRFPRLSSDPAGKDSQHRPKVGEDIDPPSPFGDLPPDQFVKGITAGDPARIDTLIIINSNPVFHSRQKDKWVRALKEIENVIYIGTFIDETAKYADAFLPDHSFLEKSDLSGPIPGLMFTHVGLQQPVIEPLFDTRQSGDVLIELGKRAVTEDAFPWKDYEELVLERLRVIFESGEGSVISESTYAQWVAYLKERGWRLQQYQTFGAFRRTIMKNGGWWNPLDPFLPLKEIFRTKSGRFEFVSSHLKERLAEASQFAEGDSAAEKRDRLLSGLHITARGDDLLMPHYEVPFSLGKTEKFPLILTISELLTNRNGAGATQPSLLEMIGVQVGRYWKSWIEINPLTGREYGLKDRGMGWVESTQGRIQGEVRFFEGIRPGVVHLHLGLGHTSYGRFGTGIGFNATDLIENHRDSLSYTPALNGTPVKVSPSLREV
ncbi:MAG: molybdopterin-dependent oxidoreductase [Candidatus Neomarinimicrobiota bacterium]